MDIKLFNEEVEISNVSLTDIWGEEIGLQLLKSMEMYYQEKKVKLNQNSTNFFSINRTEEGLVHPAYVTLFLISFKTKKRSYYANNYAVLRFFEKNKDVDDEYFDRGKYHYARMMVLKQLGKYYPPFLVVDSEIANGFLIFQKFFYYPICKFKSASSIKAFFNLVYLASVKGIFLDFNQNHFLWDEKKKHLLYTDADFIEELPFDKAVTENFNQATIYLTNHNAKWFAQTINSFKTSRKTFATEFHSYIIGQVKEKMQSLLDKEPTQVIKNRINAYQLILKYNTE